MGRRCRVPKVPLPGGGNDFVGLALSGGGIRSATFCLGVCQHLAEAKILRHVDFLSTVSGGGFLGGFVGAWIHREGVGAVESELGNCESTPVRFLRENGRYIAPNGSGDIGVALASYLRGWTAILATLGIFTFALLVAGVTAQEWLTISLPKAWTAHPALAVDGFKYFWISPWWLAPYATILIWVIPFGAAFRLLGEKPLRLTPMVYGFLILTLFLITGYMNKEPDSWMHVFRADFKGVVGILLLAAATYVWARSSRMDGWVSTRATEVTALALAALAYVACNGFHVAWPTNRHQFSPALVLHQAVHLYAPNLRVSPFDSDLAWISLTVLSYTWTISFSGAALTNNVDLVRRKLTEIAALGIWVVLGLSLFAAVDTLGGTLFKTLIVSKGADWPFTLRHLCALAPAAGAAFAAALKAMHKLPTPSTDKNPKAPPIALIASIGAAVLAIACVVFLSMCAHLIAYHCNAETHSPFGEDMVPQHDAWRTMGGIVIALTLVVLLFGLTRTLLNLSSDLQLYTARLTRAYLGASNPARQDDPAKQNVTQPVRNDDIPFTEYHPERKGGPLHIVNATVNETISGRSSLEQKDRHGFSMALGPVGISTGRTAHAVFCHDDSPVRGIGFAKHILSPQRIRTAGKLLSERWSQTRTILPIKGPSFHPLAMNPRNPSEQSVEVPTLGGWIGISGAAFSTGLGQQTNSAYSFLAGFFNVRLGYWWDSKIDPLRRRGAGAMGFREWLGYGISTIFSTQSYLIDEFLARFHAPIARRLWNLTDGGHFENTATYELVRRRVSFIIMCDCGADPDYLFEDVSNLVRKSRIDFDAEITFLGRKELRSVLAPDLIELFGHPKDFAGAQKGNCPYHAALATITYVDGKTPQGYLLVLKPSLDGSEPMDLRDYFSKNPSFPQESTLEQFFNEAQWESYRRLGRLTAERVFSVSPQATGPVRPKTWRPSGLSRPAQPNGNSAAKGLRPSPAA